MNLLGVKTVCTNIFHEQHRSPQVLSMSKKLRVVEVRHLLHISSDNLPKCVVKKNYSFGLCQFLKKTLENSNFAVHPPDSCELSETLILLMPATLCRVA